MFMKDYYDRRHQRLTFKVGEWVYVKLGNGYDIAGY